MRRLKNPSNDPYYNLAFEEYAFRHLEGSAFWLWVNRPVIVVGRNQDTLAEIDERYVREHGIDVVRRLSGGGAVYHDYGNLNYTILSDSDDVGFDFKRFARPVVEALASMGVKAEFSGRNDITIDGKKCCGNAQYRDAKRVLHHGAILFDVDLSVLASALRVSGDKMASKGIASVRSRVTNVCEHLEKPMTIETFGETILRHVAKSEELVDYTFDDEDFRAIEKLRDRYLSWDWNYGRSPGLTIARKKRYAAGSMDWSFDLTGGVIARAHVTGDFFGMRDVNELLGELVGTKYTRGDLEKFLESHDVASYFAGFSTEEMLDAMID